MLTSLTHAARALFLIAFLFITACTAPSEQTPNNPSSPPDSSIYTGNLLLTVFVSDVEKSTLFYRDTLGFDYLGFWNYEKNCYVETWESPKPPIYAGFIAGDRRFGLHKPMSDEQKTFVGKGRCYFEVTDLERHHQRVLSAGGEPSPIRDTPHLRSFYVRDPDGRYIYFAVTQENAPTYPW